MSLQLPPLPAQAQPLVADENRFSQDQYQPVSGRQKMIILGLAVTTALAIVWLLLDPPGGVVRPPRPSAASAAAVPLLSLEVLKQMQPVRVVPAGEAQPARAASAASRAAVGVSAAAASMPR